MRSTNFPQFPDTDEGDTLADEFYNDRTGSGDCRNAYECLVAVDKLLQRRGLELLMYEGGSDHTFEIVEHQPKAEPVRLKRPRGPAEVSIEEVLESAGVDPALASVIDPSGEPLDLEEERAARKTAADLLGTMIPTEDSPIDGLDGLSQEEVLALLGDKSIVDGERAALHRRLDQLLQG